jgi:hypothetical protein
MLRSLLLTASLMCGALLVSGPTFADPLTELKSPTADVPTSDMMFPAGPGSDEINGSCLTCHSADHVLNQPSLTREAWEEVVNKMIKAYKMPVDPDNVAKIVDYLVRTKGKS